MTKIVKIISTILSLVILGVVGYLFYQTNTSPITKETITSNTQPTATPDTKPITNTVGNDSEEHDCDGWLGYSWCEVKNKCLQISEEPCYINIEQEIQYQLANKYNKPTNEVNIIINLQDGNYIAGSVKFGQGNQSEEGGIFLARKVKNIWEVVFDGNGSIDCIKMRQDYGFPDTILKPNFCE
jgi:hypothetical protein